MFATKRNLSFFLLLTVVVTVGVLALPIRGTEAKRLSVQPASSVGVNAVVAQSRISAESSSGAASYISVAGETSRQARSLASSLFPHLSGSPLALSNIIGTRIVRVVPTSLLANQNGTVVIELDSQGDENAMGFSLNFDTTKLTYVSAVKGADANTAGATMNVNAVFAATGKIGIALGLPAGAQLPAGTRQMVVITFNVPASGSGSTVITFGDSPIFREIVDPNAFELTAQYDQGTISITPLPSPAPTLTSIDPTSATVGGTNFTLTVNGSGFVSGSVVRFNGIDRPTTFVNSTQLTAQISATDIQAAGSFPITVFTPAPGGGTSSAINLAVNNPVPTLVSLSPTSAVAGGADFVLTVNGTGFSNGSIVRFNGNNRSTTFVNSTQLTAQILAADISSADTASISVFNAAPGGGSSNALSFTIGTNPAFRVVRVVGTTFNAAQNNTVNVELDAQGDENALGFSLNFDPAKLTFVSAIRGSGVPSATININTSATASGRVGIALANPTGQTITPGTRQIVVATFSVPSNGNGSTIITFGDSPIFREIADVNAGNLGATYTSGTINITPLPNPVPTLTSLSPATAIVGGPNFTLTLNGSGFVSTSVVRFNGIDRPTTFVSSSQLTAEISAADIQATGSFPLTVFSPAPGGGTSSAVNLAVNNPAPTVSSLSPASALAGGPAFTLTVNGTNFINGSVVRFNGVDRTTAFVSSTALTAQITLADLQAAGVFTITVANPAPGGGSSSGLSFTVNNPSPTLSSLSQTSASAGDPAFTLTVQGTNFINGSVVRLNGVDRSTTFVSSTQLTAQITLADLQAAGVFTITVANPAPGGGTSAGLNFTVNNLLPTLSSLSQTSASAGDPAFTLTIHGTNFVNGSVVRFNGSDRSTSFISSTELTAQITLADLGVAGVFTITVANPAPGGGTTAGLGFTVNNLLPALSSLSQNSASAGDPAFTLTVHGTNFFSGSVVRLNGSDRTTTFVSSTELTVQITLADLQTAGVFTITVTNPAPGGGSSSGLSFTVNNLLPTLSSLSQSSATAGDAGFTLTVHGTNFVNGSVVRFNDSDRTTSFVSSTELTAVIAAADIQSVGTFAVRVLNPLPGGGQSNALDFTVSQPPAKIQFDVSNYTVDEGSNSVEITVIRTGDSSQAVTVDYATDDSNVFIPCITPIGAASQRCDYVTAGGTLSFAPGETRKSFKVLLYEDVYLEGTETFGITLSNGTGASLGPVPSLTVTIEDNDFVAPFYNPINEPNFFVKRHYLDLLNRLPDEGGLNYWAYEIIKCAGDEACIQDRRTRVSAAFFIELEFQQTGYVVYRLFKGAFGQNPSYERFMRDRGQLVAGPQLQATTNQFADRFVARPEFLQEYPANMTPRDFVNRLFDMALLVSHDTEREQEIDAMTNFAKTRAQVLLDLIDIQEFSQREFNGAFVLMQYFGYLRRDPDQGGYDYWLNILNNKEPDNYRGMVCAFITSREYQERTSSVLKTSNRNCGQ